MGPVPPPLAQHETPGGQNSRAGPLSRYPSKSESRQVTQMAPGTSRTTTRGRGRTTTSARLEATRQLRAIIQAVDRGDLVAEGGVAKRLLRRLEGALAVLEMEGEKK